MVAKLLTKKMEELTFDKAVTICVGLEHTTRDTAKIVGRAKQPDEARTQVNRVSDANVCPRCLLPHKEEECRFKNAFCFRCKETGHLKRACRNPKPNKGNGTKPTTKAN